MAERFPGYNGKILRVNLTSRNITVETPDALFYRKYLGGAGFVLYYLWKELAAGIDPLGPENKLIFALGPATGALIPGSGRNCIGAKSPLTGGVAKSEVGEFWGAELKRAGYDAIIVEGKADSPVYLWVHDGEVEIRDARHLWGQNTRETQQAVRTELGDKFIRVASIGPAGENLVRYAAIMNGLFDAAGRGGVGAVMGSKNLKTVAVRGHHPPEPASREQVKAIREWGLANAIKADPLARSLNVYGTGANLNASVASGNLPVRNFRDGLFETEPIDALTLKETIGVGMDGCFSCHVRCKKAVKIAEAVDPAYGGPEYETLASLGSNCGINNLQAISMGNQLCNAYSLDTISTGGTIAFAMECFENGILTAKDTGGIDLRFGNAEAMLKAIELIARREGIGELLAEGTARAAQRIGKGAERFAVHSKGLEPGMHEPRLKAALGLGFMVNPHGADHCSNVHDTAFVHERQMKALNPLGFLSPLPADDIGPRKVALFKAGHSQSIIMDCLVICRFLPYSHQQLVDITAATTGWNTGLVELMKIADRVLTVARLYNIREGFTAEDDKLPERFFQPKTDGVLSNKGLDRDKYEKAKSYYYTLMGWDSQTGVPLPEKVEELEIA
ncbi:MAG: aldehyde ferredoxin oxidoreductase family protein [Chloroflexi bacterium]|nr:aldehyde ferredoxin oxidoreductase family protein [Chloroflexota bacterium]